MPRLKRPASGTIQGYEVAGNFPGTAPQGVIENRGSKLAFAGNAQNTINPRVGFSWQLPGSDRVVLRGGYGVYHQAISGQPTVQLVFGDERHAAAEVTIGGTQRKDFLQIPSRGRHYELPHAFLLRLDDRGQITEIAAYWDNASFYSQLGKTTLE